MHDTPETATPPRYDSEGWDYDDEPEHEDIRNRAACLTLVSIAFVAVIVGFAAALVWSAGVVMGVW